MPDAPGPERRNPPPSRSANRTRFILRHAGLVLAAAAGGWLAALAALPAPWITGSMLAVVAVTLATAPRRPTDVALSVTFTDFAFLLAGTSIGFAVSPETVQALVAAPVSIAILIAATLVATLASATLLQRVAGWSFAEAVLASVPGALSTTVAIAFDRGLDVGRIVAVQLLRLLLLVAVLPGFVVALAGGPIAFAGPDGPGAMATPLGFAAMLGAGLALGLGLERARLAAPLFLGGMLGGAALHGSGLVQGALPGEIQAFAAVLIGVVIGVRFSLLDLRATIRLLPLALAVFGLVLGVSLGFAALSARLTGLSLPTAVLGFAPGAVEAMTLLAFSLGHEPFVVAAHHVVRFLAIGLLLPLAFRRPA